MKQLSYLLIFTCCFSYSQNCEFIKDEVDEFTKNQTQITKPLKFSQKNLQSEVVSVQAIKINNNRYLRVYFTLMKSFAIEDNAKLMFLDEEKNVTEFTFNEYKIADYSQQLYSQRWETSYDFILTDDEYKKLVMTNFKKLRFYTTNGYVEHEIKKKFSNNLRNVLRCIR